MDAPQAFPSRVQNLLPCLLGMRSGEACPFILPYLRLVSDSSSDEMDTVRWRASLLRHEVGERVVKDWFHHMTLILLVLMIKTCCDHCDLNQAGALILPEQLLATTLVATSCLHVKVSQVVLSRKA